VGCAQGTKSAIYDCVVFAEETLILLKNGSEIEHGGAPGAFENEFRHMENILDEVRKIIAGSNISVDGLDNLMEKLRQLRYVQGRRSLWDRGT